VEKLRKDFYDLVTKEFDQEQSLALREDSKMLGNPFKMALQ
jgi:hypothetical protein